MEYFAATSAFPFILAGQQCAAAQIRPQSTGKGRRHSSCSCMPIGNTAHKSCARCWRSGRSATLQLPATPSLRAALPPHRQHSTKTPGKGGGGGVGGGDWRGGGATREGKRALRLSSFLLVHAPWAHPHLSLQCTFKLRLSVQWVQREE